MFGSSDINNLKSKAGKAYQRFYAILDEYDCGAELCKQMSPRALAAATEFNEAWAELEKRDPNCPKGKRL